MQVWIRNFRVREVHLRWLGIAVVAYIMAFIHPEANSDGSFEIKLLKSFAFTAVYWNVAFALFIYFRKRYPEIRKTPKRLLVTAVFLTAIFVVIDPILCLIIEFKSMGKAFLLEEIAHELPINLLAAAIIGSLYENAYYFDNWKKTIQVNEALKNQQVRTQFEVLQNQMSPHFLFNSLNTLTTLIAEDSQIAINFTEKLSEVYRYILQNKEKEVVNLKEELEFVKNYVFLLQIRYPENLKVNYSIDEKYLEKSIAPLTIQILVENAIKHNVISKTNPLQIDIYIENGKSIVVKNNLQKKKTIEKSTKTGLANIRRRYEYFGKQNIDVITTANNYMVAVPILDITVDKDHLVTV